MKYLITKHAVVNFQFTNYFCGSVKITAAGTNHGNWGFTWFQSLLTIQLPLTCKGRIMANGTQYLPHKHIDRFTHYWLPGLASPRKAQLEGCHLRFHTPSLANQTRVPIAWLDFSFQQQVHHNLREIAAGAPCSQWGRVVEGGHIILFFCFF